MMFYSGATLAAARLIVEIFTVLNDAKYVNSLSYLNTVKDFSYGI